MIATSFEYRLRKPPQATLSKQLVVASRPSNEAICWQLSQVSIGHLRLTKPTVPPITTWAESILREAIFGVRPTRLDGPWSSCPDGRNHRTTWAWFMSRLGKLDRAIDFYQQAHLAAPDSAEYLANLLRARIRNGDRTPETRADLQNLKLLETRPRWKVWIDQQLVTMPTSVNGAKTFFGGNFCISRGLGTACSIK